MNDAYLQLERKNGYVKIHGKIVCNREYTIQYRIIEMGMADYLFWIPKKLIKINPEDDFSSDFIWVEERYINQHLSNENKV